MQIKFHTSARKAPDEVSGLKVPYAAAKRVVPKWRWYLILLLVSSPLIHFGVTTLYPLFLINAYGTVYMERYEIRAVADGFAKTINVKIDDQVHDGAVLINLASPTLDEKTEQLNNELAALKQAKDSSSAVLLHALEDQVELTEIQFEEKLERLQAMDVLFQQGAATVTEVRDASDQKVDAESSVNQARVDLAAEIRRTLSQDATQLNSSIHRVKAALQMLDFQRDQLPQKSPRSGTVLEVITKEGEFVSKGTMLLILGSRQDPAVIAYIDSKEAYRIQPGDKATVKLTDGTSLIATVETGPSLAKEFPKGLERQFGFLPMSVILSLPVGRNWAVDHLIYGSPVQVRFHFDWETNLKSMLTING